MKKPQYTLTHIVFLSLMARCNAFSFTRWYYSWQTSPLIPNKIRNESGEWFYLWPRADRPHETNKNKKNKILQQITFQTAGLPFENQNNKITQSHHRLHWMPRSRHMRCLCVRVRLFSLFRTSNVCNSVKLSHRHLRSIRSLNAR